MSQQLFFCSELSRNAGEQIFGTASTGELWLLVEYAHPWGARALESSALPPRVKSHLNALLKTIPRSRLLFIKRSACRETFNFFVVRARERRPYAVRLELGSYDELIGVDVASVAAGDSLAGGALTRDPFYLVCTHGKRDKCCAKFGNVVYSSLSERVGASAWRASHVGGDRFAANVVCFPHGLFYGRVDDDSASRIASEYAQGRIVLENFRGRACHPHPAQAAECFVRAEAGLTRLDDLRLASSRRAGEMTWRVRFDAPGGKVYEALVTSRVSEFRTFITCKANEPKPAASFFLDDLRALDADAAGEQTG
ncbi:MAG: sucrase ferredoxin [Acidobacteriota bacterium]|nr:sucrase ferredoxin [Acidobacteriota bacterium]